ncbi:MAG TPA: hypothetical protein VGB39_03265 [Sphingomicrobium sp.]|jgi:hypothetical protein
MQTESPDYEAICVEEFAAANRATTEEARMAHLDRALRNALLASQSRQSATTVDLMLWRSQRPQSSRGS